MLRMRRGRYSPDERAELWRRWSQGESLSDIGRALGRRAPSIFSVVVANGGIVPAPRVRAPGALSLAEREEISRGIASGCSMRAIARSLGRAASTISRELARHGGREGYRAAEADSRAWDRARRPKACRLALRRRLRCVVARKLKQQWSPEQIAGWLKAEYPNDPGMRVSHETIYRSLFIQARGELKKELISHLRAVRAMRRSKNASSEQQRRGQMMDAVSIRERPAEVEDRAVPGHWEGDLLCGGQSSYIATLVERQTRFVMLVKVESKESQKVVEALSQQVRKLPQQLRRSLTWDRGTEMAAHKEFTVATDVAVYFCDPSSPWQRGTNENTNGLLRQYFPKGMDLSGVTQAQLNKVALRLNQRPRKTLGFRPPAEKLQAVLR